MPNELGPRVPADPARAARERRALRSILARRQPRLAEALDRAVRDADQPKRTRAGVRSR